MTHNDNRLFKTALGVALAVAGIISFVTVSSAGPKTDAEAGVGASLAQMRADLQSCNGRGLSAYYTPDAQMMAPGQLITGRDAIQKHIDMVCKFVHDYRIDGQEFIASDPESAAESGVITFTDIAGKTVGVNRYMTVWKKSDGKWLIYRTISVPVGAAHPEDAVSSDVFKIKKSEPATAVILPMQGSFDQMEPSIIRLRDYLQKSGIKMVGNPFGRFFNSPDGVSTKDLRWEVGFFVAPGTSNVEAPFQVHEFPATTVVSAVIPGSPNSGIRPWQQLIAWTIAQGYFPSSAPPMEIWGQNQTEMVLPVAKAQNN